MPLAGWLWPWTEAAWVRKYYHSGKRRRSWHCTSNIQIHCWKPKLCFHVCSAALLDPDRVEQANKDTWNFIMTKLKKLCDATSWDCSICGKNYRDIKKNQICNMDKVALDTTKCRGKVLFDEEQENRLLQIATRGWQQDELSHCSSNYNYNWW